MCLYAKTHSFCGMYNAHRFSLAPDVDWRMQQHRLGARAVMRDSTAMITWRGLWWRCQGRVRLGPIRHRGPGALHFHVGVGTHSWPYPPGCNNTTTVCLSNLCVGWCANQRRCCISSLIIFIYHFPVVISRLIKRRWVGAFTVGVMPISCLGRNIPLHLNVFVQRPYHKLEL
jgi:hypothetical protein